MSKWRAWVEFEIEDEDLFWTYARERYDENWGGDIDEMIGPGEVPLERAIMEALFYSNEAPSPDTIGMNYTGDGGAVCLS